MAELLVDEQSFPSTPASGKLIGFADSSNSEWLQRNDAGKFLGDQSASITSQIASHSADTYYKGIQLPSFSMQAGMVFEWYFPVTKTAGTAAPAYTIRIGSNQSTADTSRLVINGPAQTAVVDTGFVRVMVTVRSVAVAGVMQGMVWLQHNLAATGLANTPAGFSLVEGTSAGFDNTALQGQYIGLSVNPGTSGAWVVNQVLARCWY
jgi:hypothetical protein